MPNPTVHSTDGTQRIIVLAARACCMYSPLPLLVAIAAAALSNTEDAVAEMTAAEKDVAIAAFNFLEPPTYWKHDGTAWRHTKPSVAELAAYERSRKGGKTASKKDGSSSGAASKGSSSDASSYFSSSSKAVPVSVGASAAVRYADGGRDLTDQKCSCVSSEDLTEKSTDHSHAMAKLTPKSVFMVGRNGVVFERFWNEKMWVYVAHRDSEPRVEGLDATISVAVGKKKLFASNKTGHLFERRKLRTALKWLHVSPPSPWQLAAAPLKSPTGESIFAVTKCGELLERTSFRINATAAAEREMNAAAAADASDGSGTKRKKKRSKKQHTRIVDRWYMHARPLGKHCLAQVSHVWEYVGKGTKAEKTTLVLTVDRDGHLHLLDTSKSPKIFLREYIANVEQVRACCRERIRVAVYVVCVPDLEIPVCPAFACERPPRRPAQLVLTSQSFFSIRCFHSFPPSLRAYRTHARSHSRINRGRMLCTRGQLLRGRRSRRRRRRPRRSASGSSSPVPLKKAAADRTPVQSTRMHVTWVR